jgi:stage V sporulation protein G
VPVITSIKTAFVGHSKLLGVATIVLDNCFVIKGIKIVDGCNGPFVTMPSERLSDGTFRDIAYVSSIDFQRYLQRKVIHSFEHDDRIELARIVPLTRPLVARRRGIRGNADPGPPSVSPAS